MVRHLLILAGFAAGALIDGFLLSAGPPGSLWLIGWVLEILFGAGTAVLSAQFLSILTLWAGETVVSEWFRVRARLRKVRDGDAGDAK